MTNPKNIDDTRSNALSSKFCDGIIHFGNVDWWYHNRGHSPVRIATRLAQRVPTVWVNSIGMRIPIPGKTEIAWARYWLKLKSLTKGLRQDKLSGLYIYSPLFVPLYSPLMLELNGRLLAAQVNLIRRWLQIKHPSVLVSMPSMTPAVERGQWVRIVFDRCDDFATMPEANKKVIDGLEKRLLGLANAATYVHKDLMEREQGLVKQSVFIGHGVDLDHFIAARPLNGAKTPMPEALHKLPRPLIGFYGGLDEYRMDVELLVKTARHIRPGTLLLIGPRQMDLSTLLAEPNLVHLNQVSPDRLPAYAAHFDVGVIPFLQNNFNRMSNPTKLKEYLALGYPIVATMLPAYKPYQSLIYTANSHSEFLNKLDQARQEDNLTLIKQRRAAVTGKSWEQVAAQVAGLLAAP